MASYYVWSGAAGSANGSSWANAFLTLMTAFSGKAAGDIFYVAHDHAQSATSVLLTSPGTMSNPCKVICVDRAGSVPPVSADRRTTAQIASSANNNLNIDGYTHYDGIIFTAGSGASSSAGLVCSASLPNNALRFDNCSLRTAITGSAISRIILGGGFSRLGGCYTELNNTTMSFGHAAHLAEVCGVVKWRNTPSALLGTIPTILLNIVVDHGGLFEAAGVDFSAAGSGKTIAGIGNNAQGATYRFMDCKLNAAVTRAQTGAFLSYGAEVDFIRSGATGVNYTVYSQRLSGALTEETTIVRTGGASDGTTTISWKIVTTANCSYSLPFEAPPIAIWNDVTGSSITATVEGIWGGGAVPNDDDVWLDVEYLGDASSPQGSFVNDGKADLLTTAAGQTSSSETWGGSTTKFKLNVSFTAQQKGWIYCRVKVGKASTTVYIDPLVTLT